MSGWWSVTTVNWGRPARKILHLVMAHATARSSNSMMVYQLSGSEGSEILPERVTMCYLSFVEG